MVSALIYLLAALTIIGAFYVALLAIVYWVSHGLMTGHLRGSAVRITEHQFPEAHAELVRLCDQLELEVPEAYVMEAGGVLNAFATRFGGRNFVVLFSDIFELAYDDGKDALAFVLAHELAHLRHGHPIRHVSVTPAMFVPFLGAAYSRACERTCDREATALCPAGVERGFLALAAGRRLSLRVDRDAFTAQWLEGGFWYRFSEVLSSHPHLGNRLSACMQLRRELSSQASSGGRA